MSSTRTQCKQCWSPPASAVTGTEGKLFHFRTRDCLLGSLQVKKCMRMAASEREEEGGEEQFPVGTAGWGRSRTAAPSRGQRAQASVKRNGRKRLVIYINTDIRVLRQLQGHRPATPAPERMNQELKASLGYVKPCLKKQKKKSALKKVHSIW